MKPDTKSLIETILTAVKDYTSAQLKSIDSRISKIEKSTPADGKSVYDIAKDAGFTGTEAEWLSSIRGSDGRDGRDGRDGYHGRDAVEIDIGKGIDSAKSYPPGVYMSHAGGLVKSSRHTDPLDEKTDLADAGWQVLVSGVDSVSFDLQEDGRTVLAKVKTTGKTYTHSVAIPSVIDRGVYKSAEEYTAGDAVTWGGSLWIAQTKTNAKPGEAGSDWRLAVKRGRDGKDGKNGERGERGIEGKAGRDLTQMDFSGRKW